MIRDLIQTYLLNFAYVITKAIVFALACFFTWRLFDWMEKLDVRAEIAERHNVGLAIMIAALFLGLAYVIGQI
jgi:uncharacterized membrane protein